jgi:hypothetical protein
LPDGPGQGAPSLAVQAGCLSNARYVNGAARHSVTCHADSRSSGTYPDDKDGRILAQFPQSGTADSGAHSRPPRGMGSEGFPRFPTEQVEQVTDGSSHRDRGLEVKPDGRARAQDAMDSVPSTQMGPAKGSANHPR